MGLNKAAARPYETIFKTGSAILLLCVLAIFPAFGDAYYIHLVILSFIWAVVGSSWNLIMGYAGIHSFGTLAFFAVGAYSAGVLEVLTGLSPWMGLILGGIGAAFAGFIIGLPCLRLKGLYIVLVTVAFHQVIPIFIKLGAKWTGGDVGLMGMPQYNFFGYTFAGSKIAYYYLAFFLFLFFNFLIYRVIRSDLGLGFVALRDSEAFAESLGVNRTRSHLITFVISSFIIGIMGALYVHYLKVATPRILEIEIFAGAIMIVVIGGLGKFPGVLVTAFLVTFLNEFLRTAGLLRPIIFGALIIAVIILLPDGVSGLIDSFYRFLTKLFGTRGRQRGSL
jgi:branched-chain amino acid transport system permease protein